MSWSKESMRELRLHFQSLARGARMANGSIRLTVDQSSVCKVEALLIYKYHRPKAAQHKWDWGSDAPKPVVERILDHIGVDLENLVIALVPEYGWIEANIKKRCVTNVVIHVSFCPQRGFLAGR